MHLFTLFLSALRFSSCRIDRGVSVFFSGTDCVVEVVDTHVHAQEWGPLALCARCVLRNKHFVAWACGG